MSGENEIFILYRSNGVNFETEIAEADIWINSK